MKDKTSKSADQLFREVLNDHTPEFNPMAWEHMKTLLDEDDIKPVLIALPQSKNKHYKLILITIIDYLIIHSIFINPTIPPYVLYAEFIDKFILI